MRNLRAAAATLKPLFENPELGAMAEICEILQALPDDGARLRVMRWSFARFGGEEFKRPQPVIAPPRGIPTQAGIQSELSISHYESIADDMPAMEDMDR